MKQESDKVGKALKKVVVAYFKDLSQNSFG
jgi:hypothetical protein